MSEKLLDRDTYLKALALFTMARQHAVKGREFEVEMASLLGFDGDYMGHLSDEIYGDGRFDDALKREGFSGPSS